VITLSSSLSKCCSVRVSGSASNDSCVHILR
jgi:hypothetical protein